MRDLVICVYLIFPFNRDPEDVLKKEEEAQQQQYIAAPAADFAAYDKATFEKTIESGTGGTWYVDDKLHDTLPVLRAALYPFLSCSAGVMILPTGTLSLSGENKRWTYVPGCTDGCGRKIEPNVHLCSFAVNSHPPDCCAFSNGICTCLIVYHVVIFIFH